MQGISYQNTASILRVLHRKRHPLIFPVQGQTPIAAKIESISVLSETSSCTEPRSNRFGVPATLSLSAAVQAMGGPA